MSNELNGLGVDLFGLDEFGQATGLSPLWGAVAGAGFQSAGAIAWRAYKNDKDDAYADLVGAGAGALAGGVMMAFEGTRHAGWTAVAVSLVAGLSRYAETKLMEAPAGATAGYGLPTIEPQYALGLPTIEPTQAFGNADMPQLVGNQPELVGGPAVSGLAQHYGATLFGGN